VASLASVPQAFANYSGNFPLPLLLQAQALSSAGLALHDEEAEDRSGGGVHLQQPGWGRGGGGLSTELESCLQPAGTRHRTGWAVQERRAYRLVPWWQRGCHVTPALCSVVWN